jgi:hypothetical protein
VELQGSNGAGSVTFTVTKANKKGSALVGKSVALTIAAGSTVHANACIDAAGALTLKELELKPGKVEKAKTPEAKGSEKQKGKSGK